MSQITEVSTKRKRRFLYVIGAVAVIVVLFFALTWEYTPIDSDFKEASTEVFFIFDGAMNEVRELNEVEQKTADMFFSAYKEEYGRAKEEYLEEGHEADYNAYNIYQGLLWMQIGLEGYLKDRDEKSMGHFLEGKEVCETVLDVG